MARTLFFIILLLFIVFIEIYTYHGLKSAFPHGRKKVIVFIIYAISVFSHSYWNNFHGLLFDGKNY